MLWFSDTLLCFTFTRLEVFTTISAMFWFLEGTEPQTVDDFYHPAFSHLPEGLNVYQKKAYFKVLPLSNNFNMFLKMCFQACLFYFTTCDK